MITVRTEALHFLSDLGSGKRGKNAKCKIFDGFEMSFLQSAAAGTIPQHNNRELILKTILSP